MYDEGCRVAHMIGATRGGERRKKEKGEHDMSIREAG
jgi:hypothetical protein